MGAELRKPTELEQGYGSDAAAGTGAHTTADTARGPQGTAGGLGGPEAGFIRFLFLGRTAGGSQDGRGGASGADRYERQGAVEGGLRSDRRAFVVRRSTYEPSGDTGARRANPKSMRRSEAALR